MHYIHYIAIAIGVILILLTGIQESRKRKINVFFALLILFLATPLFGYFILSNIAIRNPIGCKWCGNNKNEVEYCGICNNTNINTI